jgi:nondiscriminating aspartyl-tRNA synthetase
MERTLSKDVVLAVGSRVLTKGWLHKKRLLGGLTFVTLRDRSGVVQILIEDKTEVEKLRGMQIGTVLAVEGTVIEEPRSPGGAELHEPTITVLTPVTAESPIEIDKPLSHKSEHLETLFDNRVIGLRNLQETAIFKLRSEINKNIRLFLWGNDFTEMQTPKLLAGATEGGAEVFKLDYFGQEATLAQSPQFYKQILVGVFERVFEIAPTYRAETSATTRHVSEVTMLDIEMGFIEKHDDVLNMIETMVYTVLTNITKDNSDLLKRINAPEIKLLPTFPRFTVAEIHEMYFKATGKDIRHEKDLIPDEEKWVCEYARKNLGCDAVFATNFPVEAMKFYHGVNPEDPQTVLWADLLFRGVEIATCPVREHNYDKLVEQMKKAGLDPEHPGYKFYLQAFKHGLPMHGGCGFGLDRFVQKICGLANVKEAILFPRDINRLTP